jgi:nitrogenase molybdenum-cofactor synthesis protein NifE
LKGRGIRKHLPLFKGEGISPIYFPFKGEAGRGMGLFNGNGIIWWKTMIEILEARKNQIHETGNESAFDMACEKVSVAGSVSQRACVFCGSRVVLYPIADALHLIHGPVGCAAYTWDIRGSLSSGPELHRLSFSTDLREEEVIYGGEKKLYAALTELIAAYHPKAAFVYATCIIGLIGDDIQAVCRKVPMNRASP